MIFRASSKSNLAKALILFLAVVSLAVLGCSPAANSKTKNNNGHNAAVFAANLQIPWEIVFLPGGDVLVTERPGRLKRLGEKEATHKIPDVYHAGEGGLLGMALHPDFEENRYLYLYLTYREGGQVLNRVDRYIYSDGRLSDKKTIISNIPGAVIHNGGRIAFGHDGCLYITTGDAAEPALAQDINSLAGKILRIKDSGDIFADNPFSSAVYSYGHRNPQGLAWDKKGRLWSTEHGAIGNDELNLIEKGKNYGWPLVEGDQSGEGMESPVIHSGRNTWAPSGMVYHQEKIYFTGLRGESVYVAAPGLQASDAELYRYLEGRYGRLRNIRLGPDGNFYILTSNRDGRGRPAAADDRIIIIDSEELEE